MAKKLALPYDTLVVKSAGPRRMPISGTREWAEFAPGMRKPWRMPATCAVTFSVPSRWPSWPLTLRSGAAYLTFVVVGAGPTGVELVGQVAELAMHQSAAEDYRSAVTTEAKILLVEGGPAVLGSFHPKLQRYTRRRLEKMGVDVQLNTAAIAMDHDSITFVQGPGGQARSWRPEREDLGGER